MVPLEAVRELAREAEDARKAVALLSRELERERRELDGVRADAAHARAEADAWAQEVASLRDELAALRAAPPAAPPVALPEPQAPVEESARIRELLADLANVRRQRDAEVERVRLAERAELLGHLADVTDDLERALASHPDPASPWVAGTVALLGRVRHQLERAGGVRFGRFGDPFDPVLHEAVGTAQGAPDTVVAVQRSGVRLEDGTVVRPAAVLVGVPPASVEEPR